MQLIKNQSIYANNEDHCDSKIFITSCGYINTIDLFHDGRFKASTKHYNGFIWARLRDLVLFV